MARKFGKKVQISSNPFDYSLYLMGEAGVGKTTIIKKYCERIVGEDGYMFLTMGKESDFATINGIVSEPVWNWEHFSEVVDDIIENRYEDYADLKVVVIDTVDELMNMAEAETIRLWNKSHPDKKTNEFKATWSGFNGPTDKATELVIDKLWSMKRVGVSFIIIGHTKKTDITDPITLESYSILSTNMDKRYFNALKNKVDIVGVAYIDREIARIKTGRKNIVNGKEEIVGKLQNESRVICFRDNSYSVDSKSRFANIVDKIPLDADELIKAIKDAIDSELNNKTDGAVAVNQKVLDEERKERIEKYKADKNADEIESHRDEYFAVISDKFSAQSTEVKAAVKDVLAEGGFKKLSDPEIPAAMLKRIADMME